MTNHTSKPAGANTFDPTSFLLVPAKRFGDLKVGDIFRAPSRTLTDAHASAFQTVSADNHPVHYEHVGLQSTQRTRVVWRAQVPVKGCSKRYLI